MIRLFTSGKHNQMEFTNQDIEEIYQTTIKGDLKKIPFVSGHPKNDLPIYGWVAKDKLSLYPENGKMSIGFQRSDADFSEDSLSNLRKKGQDKISVRLQNNAITHIGLVEKAAVIENNDQTFALDKSGHFSFGDQIDLSAKNSENAIFNVLQEIKNLFTQKTNPMNPNPNQAILDENAQLKAKLAEFEKKENLSEIEKENQTLKTKLAEFEKSQKSQKLKDFEAKVEASSLSAEEKTTTKDFAAKLLDKDETLFEEFAKKEFATSKIPPHQGNVLPAKDFAQGSNATQDFENEIKNQLNQSKK
jgi:hypothetical protein